MRKFLHDWALRIPVLIMSVVTVCWIFLPGGSFASKQMTNGHGDINGDPIDGNDFGSGGAGGGIGDLIYVNQNSVPSGGQHAGRFLVLPVSLSGMRIMVVPQFQSGLFSVRFMMIPAVVDHPEAIHAE